MKVYKKVIELNIPVHHPCINICTTYIYEFMHWCWECQRIWSLKVVKLISSYPLKPCSILTATFIGNLPMRMSGPIVCCLLLLLITPVIGDSRVWHSRLQAVDWGDEAGNSWTVGFGGKGGHFYLKHCFRACIRRAVDRGYVFSYIIFIYYLTDIPKLVSQPLCYMPSL